MQFPNEGGMFPLECMPLANIARNLRNYDHAARAPSSTGVYKQDSYALPPFPDVLLVCSWCLRLSVVLGRHIICLPRPGGLPFPPK